ncbi:MAG: hypothetical protein CVU65_08920 [Deltaproteobacteria bacterium HGW-Deltaproteobacteria-22]|jgi:alpha-tubulin suppressor-like RCC1 family protein|nr:MAG: hypothetical protein CVU65_08920 [Deltaproteobacteria bacterium HGW-Deltaproteobacteria-22]
MRDHSGCLRLLYLFAVFFTFTGCNWILEWEDERPGVCSNGVREAGETCDGTDLGGQTCEGLSYTGGVLTCRADCTLDPAECTRCGDGVAEGEETCDIEDTRNVTCASLEYYGGQINCSETCELILTDCESHGRCGDSQIQVGSGEVCDTDNLDGQTCGAFDRWAGDPVCNDYCNQILTSACTGVVSMASGTAHTCLVDEMNIPFCWGDNRQGQAGAGQAMMATRPVWLDAVSCPSMVRATAGFDATCLFCEETFEMWCFGDNRSGQLGLDDTQNRPAPASVPPPGGQDWLRIAMGADHACGVVGDGDLVCAGANAFGQLGTADLTPSTTFVPVTGPLDLKFFMVAAGDGFTCALDELGHLWCWGRNDRGQVGDGTNEDRLQPTEITVSGVSSFIHVTAGVSHVCALDDTYAAWCWGAGENGRLGNGQTGDSPVPVAVHMPPVTVFQELSCQGRSCCGRDTPGRVFCWGANDAAQLGIGAGADRSEPIQALTPAGELSVWLATGGSHVCMFTESNHVWCWGAGTSGQLGQGDTAPALEPVRVVP